MLKIKQICQQFFSIEKEIEAYKCLFLMWIYRCIYTIYTFVDVVVILCDLFMADSGDTQ